MVLAVSILQTGRIYLRNGNFENIRMKRMETNKGD
jgi:hypothetical protein